MIRTKRWPIVVAMAFLVQHSHAAALPKAKPIEKDGQLVLFDPGRHDPGLIRHYTARWQKGSDLVPVARRAVKGNERYVEISYKGKTGAACSTIFLEKMPQCRPGARHAGLKLILDCDRDDYPRISVAAHFSDHTQLTRNLTLDRGRHEYVFNSGFRRADFPPKWERLEWVWLSAKADGKGNDLVFRLGRIVMRSEKRKAEMRKPPVAGRLLTPEPKHVLWGKGALKARACDRLMLPDGASRRTRTTARLFAERFSGYTGRHLRTAGFTGDLPARGVVLRIGRFAALKGKPEKLKPQGYGLTVEPDRVVITGADEAGLFHGIVTFFQLLTGSMRITEDMPVPCVEILDWPDTPNRLARLEHTHNFRNYPVRENRGIEYLMEWTDRFVAGNKLNVLFLDISALVKHKRRPEFNGTERIYSLDDLRRFSAFCRDRFVDLCPAWQIGGHASWWMLVGYHPELREKGWYSQADVTHPRHDAIMFDCMLDVIEAIKPKYVSPKSDEWWHTRRAGETPDKLLHGRTRAEAFLDVHVKLNTWLKARGIRMMMFHDMLTPYHNGKRYGLYKIIDRFPKDVIIQLWDAGTTEKDLRWFTERGFEVWTNGTGFVPLGPKTRKLVRGYGKGLYSFGAYRGGLLDKFTHLHSMGSLIHSADYAWNLSRREGEHLDHARLIALRHLLAVRPNPRAGQAVVPIDIAKRLTHSFAAFMKDVKPKAHGRHDRPIDIAAGTRDVGHLPMLLAGSPERNCIVLRKGAEPVTLPVGRRCSSLIFLHTGYVNDPADPAVRGARVRRWMYGWPCGQYVIRYDDRKEIIAPVRLTLNVKRFDTSSINRATNDNRHVLALTDRSGSDVHLYQWEWINPRPTHRIVEVVARHDNELDVSLILFALSTREVRSAASTRPSSAAVLSLPDPGGRVCRGHSRPPGQAVQDDLAVGGVFEVGRPVARLEVEDPSPAGRLVPPGAVLHDRPARRVPGEKAEQDRLGAPVGEMLVQEHLGVLHVQRGVAARQGRCVGRDVLDRPIVGHVVRRDVVARLEVHQRVRGVSEHLPRVFRVVPRGNVDSGQAQPVGVPHPG